MSSDITNIVNGATMRIRILNRRMSELTSIINNIQNTVNNLQSTVNNLQSTVNNLQICKLNKAGDTMTGDLDMNNNNITDVSLINNFNMYSLDNNLTLLSIDLNNKVDK